MRYSDVSIPLFEGMRYGAKEQNWVLENLDLFNFGFEIELKYDNRNIDLSSIDFSIYTPEEITISEVIQRYKLNRSDVVENLIATISGIIKADSMVTENNVVLDGFDKVTARLLDKNNNPLSDWESRSTEDKLEIITNITRDINELPHGSTIDDYQYYLDEAITAVDGIPHYQLVLDDYDTILTTLSSMVERMDNVVNSDANVSELDSQVNDFLQILESIDENELYGIPLSVFLVDGLRELIPAIASSDITFAGLFEMLTDETSYDSFINEYYQRLKLPVDALSSMLIDAEQLFLIPSDIPHRIRDELGNKFKTTSYDVIIEHDNQIEVITSKVVTGSNIPALFDEAYQIIDYITSRYNFYTSGVSGLHLSISINKNTTPNIPKFVVLSQLLKLIPKEANYIRMFVADLNTVLADNIPRLLQMVSKDIGTGDITRRYPSILSRWMDETLRNEKHQSINFRDIDIMNGRVELRFFGGEGYEKVKDKDRELLLRAMYALSIAYDDSVMETEYLKAMDKTVQDQTQKIIGMTLHRYIGLMRQLTSALRKITDMPQLVIPIDKPQKKVINYFKLIGEIGNIDDDIIDQIIKSITVVDEKTLMIPSESMVARLSRTSKSQITESSNMKIGDVVSVVQGNEDADFWIVRRGSVENLGKVLDQYDPNAFGITIKDSEMLDVNYAKYFFKYLHMRGTWAQHSHGSLRLVHITKEDVLNLPLEVRR